MINLPFSNVFAVPGGLSSDLPIIHTTISKSFLTIFRDLEFWADKECSVLLDYYAFFYFGRAAYRPNEAKNRRGPTHELCVFIFDSEKFRDAVESVRTIRIHPFDTGAFSRYESELGWADVSMGDFELPPRLSVCSEVIALFWPDNVAYLNCEAIRLLRTPSTHFDNAVVHYHELVRRLIGSPTDDRCASIEIAVLAPREAPLRLPAGALKGIVVPHRLLGSKEILAAMSTGSFAVRTYQSHEWLTPMERYETIMTLARELI